MRAVTFLFGLALSLAASAAVACPRADRCDYRAYDDADSYERSYDADRYDQRGFEDDRYGPTWEAYDAPAVWEDERGLYIHGHRGAACDCAPPPPCACGGELTLASSFFDGAGGVGPIPDGGYYGGGYYIAYGGSSSHAHASASARASASVSVRYRGGGRHGHGGHKHGHKGGHGGGKGH